MKRPTGVTILAVLAIFFGIANILLSLPYFGVTAVIAPLVGAIGDMAASTAMWFGLGLLVAGIVQLATGIGAMNMSPWAWVVGVLAFGANLIVAVLAMITIGFTSGMVLSAAVAALLFGYLFTRDVRLAFDHEDGSLFHSGHHGGITPA